ncbi:hypothetical protein ACIGFJ_08100 [Brevundimonas diminuta]|uniref:hypothetical protein n=1 Tax=Brevundimonas diminuta TaxID=293 RepID=UPI0037C8EE52
MKLAADNLDVETVTTIYTCPPGQRAIVTVNLCNRGATPAKLRVALTSGAAPTDADWIEYDTPVQAAGAPGGSVLQLTGIALGGGQRIYARSSTGEVSAVVFGIEEVAG